MLRPTNWPSDQSEKWGASSSASITRKAPSSRWRAPSRQGLSLDEYVSEACWEAVVVRNVKAEGHDQSILERARKLLEIGQIRLIFTEMNYNNHNEGQDSYIDRLRFMARAGYSLVAPPMRRPPRPKERAWGPTGCL